MLREEFFYYIKTKKKLGKSSFITFKETFAASLKNKL